MTPRAFLRWALAAPVVVPMLGLPLLRVERHPFELVGQLLAGSLVAGLVPYLAFAALFDAWAHDRDPAEVERTAWLAPMLFLIPFTGFWLVLVTVRGDSGALSGVLTLSAFAVGMGYVYVVAAGVLYRVLSRRGVIRPA